MSNLETIVQLAVKKTDLMVLYVRDLIMVPVFALPSLLAALHLYLGKVFERYFYVLKREVSIQQVTDSCEQCSSLKKLPK